MNLVAIPQTSDEWSCINMLPIPLIRDLTPDGNQVDPDLTPDGNWSPNIGSISSGVSKFEQGISTGVE